MENTWHMAIFKMSLKTSRETVLSIFDLNKHLQLFLNCLLTYHLIGNWFSNILYAVFKTIKCYGRIKLILIFHVSSIYGAQYSVKYANQRLQHYSQILHSHIETMDPLEPLSSSLCN